MSQTPSIILPQVWTLGTEQEIIADIATHISIDIPTEFLEEKQIHIIATEAVGVAGNLWCWVELSPVSSATSVAFFAAIGGGGGALAPVAPLIEAGVGAGTVHTILLPWLIHSPVARLVVQTPVMGAGIWAVQALVSAKKFSEVV